MGIPAKTKTLALMAYELGLWVHRTLRVAAMLGAVENQYSSINAHGGYNIRVLRLVSRLVDLARVIYPLFNIELNRRLLARCRIAITANFSALLVIVKGVRGRVLWQLDLGDLQVVLRTVGSMSTNQESVYRVVLFGRAVQT